MSIAFRAPLAAAFVVFATALPALAAPVILGQDTIVRKGPGEQYEHVWDWVAGTRIDVTECKTTNWCYAFRTGKRGWIKLDDLGVSADGGGGTTADNGGSSGGKTPGGNRGAPGGTHFVKAGSDGPAASYPSNAQLLGGGVAGGGGSNSSGGGRSIPGSSTVGANAASEAALLHCTTC